MKGSKVIVQRFSHEVHHTMILFSADFHISLSFSFQVRFS